MNEPDLYITPPSSIRLTAVSPRVFTQTARLDEIAITRQRIEGDGVGLGVNGPADRTARPINRIAGGLAFVALIWFALKG